MTECILICAGKLKEKFYADACAEYLKRMPECRVMELAEQKGPDGLKKEAAAILAAIPKGAFTAAMCIEGKLMSSQELSELITGAENRGKSRFCFIIGSSEGLHDEVKNRCDVKISMSPMTFPHHLARVMVLEQIYRAKSIAAGTRYHK